MGGGGFLGLGPAPSAPAAPDYTGAAQATAAGNLAAAQAAAAANRVNQITPYGNLTYSQSGGNTFNNDAYKTALDAYNQAKQSYKPQYDENGNITNQLDISAPNYSDFVTQGNPTWTANVNLSDVGQQLLNNQNQASLGLGSTINSALGRTQQMMGQGFNPNLPSTGFNAGQSYQDAYMQRLAPQIEQSRESNTAALANQGIVQGTKAYDNAMRQQAMRENDLLLGATTQGFGTGLQANQQAYNQALTNYNLPFNTLSALRTGAQVQNPSFVNVPQQATTSGADILGASQMGYNAQMGNFNAQQAAQQGLNSGLMGLGGTLGAAAIMSDIRTKEHIKQIGFLPNGLSVYEYEYKPEWKNEAGHGKFIGVMAQEVEVVQPEAVITREDGYKMVNYGALNG